MQCIHATNGGSLLCSYLWLAMWLIKSLPITIKLTIIFPWQYNWSSSHVNENYTANQNDFETEQFCINFKFQHLILVTCCKQWWHVSWEPNLECKHKPCRDFPLQQRLQLSLLVTSGTIYMECLHVYLKPDNSVLATTCNLELHNLLTAFYHLIMQHP